MLATPSGVTMRPCVQAANDPAAMTVLVHRGADVSKLGAKLSSKALEEKQDKLLAALLAVVKAAVLDTLDLQYRHLVAEGLPYSAAALLKRTSDNPGAPNISGIFMSISMSKQSPLFSAW